MTQTAIFERVGAMISSASFHDLELALDSLDIQHEEPDVIMAWLVATRALVASPARARVLRDVRARMDASGEGHDFDLVLRCATDPESLL